MFDFDATVRPTSPKSRHNSRSRQHGGVGWPKTSDARQEEARLLRRAREIAAAKADEAKFPSIW